MSAATVAQSGADSPPRLLTIEAALLRRLVELRDQARRFAEQATDAEAKLAAARARLSPWGNPAAATAAVERLTDDAQRLTVAARTAGRIVAEAEREYRALTGEPAPAAKTCEGCGLPVPLADFPTRHDTGRPRPACRSCWNERQRAGYRRHADKRRAELRERYRRLTPAERDAQRAYQRDYYHRNRDILRPRYAESAKQSKRRRRNAAATGS